MDLLGSLWIPLKPLILFFCVPLIQSGDTELSGIPLDLGESKFSNLGDSPRSRGINFV